MAITILFFAGLAEKAGTRRETLPAISGETVAGLRDRVVASHPAIADFVPNLVYAVDEEYADDGDAVPDGATVAFIPPVSGGQ